MISLVQNKQHKSHDPKGEKLSRIFFNALREFVVFKAVCIDIHIAFPTDYRHLHYANDTYFDCYFKLGGKHCL